LPELVTAITAVRHGHGDLAIGNVIGADILNVLFVAGAAAAVTPQGLTASSSFFYVFFPAMMFVLIVFRVGVMTSKDTLKRPFGVVLLLAYLIATVASYVATPGALGQH
jgi:cation:H+ antiporter